MERLLHRKALKGDPLTTDFADSALKIKVLLPVYTKPTQLASPNSFWPQFIDALIRAGMTKKCSYVLGLRARSPDLRQRSYSAGSPMMANMAS